MSVRKKTVEEKINKEKTKGKTVKNLNLLTLSMIKVFTTRPHAVHSLFNASAVYS